MKKNLRYIYLIRHGEALPPGKEGPWYIGHTDLPLSPAGKDQSDRLAKRFADADLGAIFSSDLLRSLHTARIISSKGSHPAVRSLSSLREIHLGEWEGRTMKDIKITCPEEYERRGSAMDTFRPPGGESFSDLADRVMPVFNEILDTTERDILIAAHAGVNRVILCSVLGIPLKNLLKISQRCGCVNTLALGNRITLELLNG